jgi:aminoglycoside phosphotransferase (APT) family kinase protein
MHDAEVLAVDSRDRLLLALDLLPELTGRALTLTALSGGITNRNFQVEAEGTSDRWVIRMPGNDTHLLGIDRDAEHAATVAADAVGLATPGPSRPCHNDLLNANFIDDGDRVRIIDWEYAGMGDPMFDPGNLSANHELTADEDASLLQAYAGALDERQLARLTIMRVVSEFREATWGVLQQGVSTLDIDFVGYAGSRFNRLLAMVATARFDRAMDEAARS